MSAGDASVGVKSLKTLVGEKVQGSNWFQFSEALPAVIKYGYPLVFSSMRIRASFSK